MADLGDLLRHSPDRLVAYYLGKDNRPALPPDSPILKDPAVRLYSAVLTRTMLCKRYWDADWRTVAPNIHKPGVELNIAYRSTLGALFARIDTLKALAAGGKDTTTVGRLINAKPHLKVVRDELSRIDSRSLVEACKRDVGAAPMKKGLSYFVDKKLSRNPPPGVKMRAADETKAKSVSTSQASRGSSQASPASSQFSARSSSQSSQASKSVVVSTTPSSLLKSATQRARSSASEVQPAITPAPSNIVPAGGAPSMDVKPTVASTSSVVPSASSDTKPAIADSSLPSIPAMRPMTMVEIYRLAGQAGTIARRNLQRFGLGHPSLMVRSVPTAPVAPVRFPIPTHLGIGSFGSSVTPPEATWACENCGYRNTETSSTTSNAGVEKESSSAAQDVCVSCEEPRSEQQDTTDTERACTHCQDLLPAEVSERDRLYSPAALKSHMREWHSDYAIAAAWRDQQKIRSGGSFIWVCPSKRCPWAHFMTTSDFETHLVRNHLNTPDKRIPARYLFSIACAADVADLNIQAHSLNTLEKRACDEEIAAEVQTLKDLAQLESLVAAEVKKQDTAASAPGPSSAGPSKCGMEVDDPVAPAGEGREDDAMDLDS